MVKQHVTGFTLIELLVVIGIIGLLSSIVIVNVREAKWNAQLARAKSFDRHVRWAFPSETVGEWTFDDGTAHDTSSYDHDGVLLGGAVITASGCVIGSCLQTNGGYVEIPDFPEANFGSGIDFAVSLWIKMNAAPPDSAGFFQKFSGSGYGIYSWGTEGRVKTRLGNQGSPGNPGFGGEIGWDIGLNDGRWHHLLFSVERIGETARLYYDGAILDDSPHSIPASGVLGLEYVTLEIGQSSTGNSFNGFIDDVRLIRAKVR